MLKFEYKANNPEYAEQTHEISITTHQDVYIGDIVDSFVTFLRAIGFYNNTIITAFEETIEEIKDEVKEDYIMLSDDEIEEDDLDEDDDEESEE
jgi:hypothetical protein